MSTAGVLARPRSRGKIKVHSRRATCSSFQGWANWTDPGGDLDPESLAKVFLLERHRMGCCHYVAGTYHLAGGGARPDGPGAFTLDHWGGSDSHWRPWHSTWPTGSTRYTGSMARRRFCGILGIPSYGR